MRALFAIAAVVAGSGCGASDPAATTPMTVHLDAIGKFVVQLATEHASHDNAIRAAGGQGAEAREALEETHRFNVGLILDDVVATATTMEEHCADAAGQPPDAGLFADYAFSLRQEARNHAAGMAATADANGVTAEEQRHQAAARALESGLSAHRAALLPLAATQLCAVEAAGDGHSH